jgi:hypothetical protein
VVDDADVKASIESLCDRFRQGCGWKRTKSEKATWTTDLKLIGSERSSRFAVGAPPVRARDVAKFLERIRTRYGMILVSGRVPSPTTWSYHRIAVTEELTKKTSQI